jgi:hypothetical protein
MVGCQECGATFEREQDLEFVDLDVEQNWLSFQSPKRFYVTACADCGAIIGTGVAGAV